MQSYAWIFYVPVDPVALSLPDYFDVIKKPMDLGTIRRKMDAGEYLYPHQFAEDVRQMFTNCYRYNHSVCRLSEAWQLSPMEELASVALVDYFGRAAIVLCPHRAERRGVEHGAQAAGVL
jgi:hypothetical protein